MKKIKGQMIKIFALVAALFAAGTIGMKEAGASEERTDSINQWICTARTVEQVKADFNSMQDNTYTIVMGDTLWTLGEASGISFMEIAERNGISDPDWIVEGHKLIFENDGRTVHIQDRQGKVKEQIIVENPSVGNSALTIDGKNNSTLNLDPNSQNNSQKETNPVPPKTDDGSTDSTTSPNIPDNDSGTGENNTKPNPPENDNDSEIDNGSTNPPTDEDNGNGSGGEETGQELYRITPLGNSDMEFDSNIVAVKWGHAQTIDPESPWYGMIPTSKPLLWSNGEILSYSVDFY